jgi:hypothetical protein
MSELPPVDASFQAIADKALQNAPRRPGRPMGARNYSGMSYIARCMKERGVSWAYELVSAYMLYKKQLALMVEDPTRPAPDRALLDFWTQMIPYITVKMIERETRGVRPKYKGKQRISHAAIEALAKAEGRKIQ